MKRFTAGDAAELLAQAQASPRGRKNLNWHEPQSDAIQRFFNLMLAGTYVRPHRHSLQNRWELTLLLDGTVDLLSFDDQGLLLSRETLSGDATRAVEVPPQTWHSYVVRAGSALLFEVKQGPYDAGQDKRFADWAPAEHEPGAERMLQWLLHANPGDRAPRRGV